MRALGWVLTQSDWCPGKRMRLGHPETAGMGTEEKPCEDTVRRGPSASQKERSHKEPNQPVSSSQTSSFQSSEKINFS